jgi:hypothetical protein
MFGHFQATAESSFPAGRDRRRIRTGGNLHALLLGIASVFFLCPPARLRASSFPSFGQKIAVISSLGLRPSFPASKRGEVTTSPAEGSTIEAALRNVNTPSLAAVGKALGITALQAGPQVLGASGARLEVVGDLDGDGVAEVAVEWSSAEPGGNESAAPEPGLYLLSWDGKGWRASRLMRVSSPFELEVLPGSEGRPRLLAVVVSEGVTAVPYPVIFQFSGHVARLLWDARSDSSFYTGFDYGAVRFKQADGGGVPELIASGRADPGLLVFPKGPESNGRGFEETRIYAWKSHAYVPVQTAYTANEDYTLYRFIADLHLHEFRAAYGLIDPQRFLKTAKPTLKLFEARIEKDWPEFLDDRIFQVPSGAAWSRGHAFILKLENGAATVYLPTFTADPQHLLAGLDRKQAGD